MVSYYENYDTEGFYGAYFEPGGKPRSGVHGVLERLETLPAGKLKKRQMAKEARLFQMGVRFTVQGEDKGIERIFPFNIPGARI